MKTRFIYWLSQFLYHKENQLRRFRLHITGARMLLDEIEDLIIKDQYDEANDMLTRYRMQFGDMVQNIELQSMIDVITFLDKDDKEFVEGEY